MNYSSPPSHRHNTDTNPPITPIQIHPPTLLSSMLTTSPSLNLGGYESPIEPLISLPRYSSNFVPIRPARIFKDNIVNMTNHATLHPRRAHMPTHPPPHCQLYIFAWSNVCNMYACHWSCQTHAYLYTYERMCCIYTCKCINTCGCINTYIHVRDVIYTHKHMHLSRVLCIMY
jgi:hypothetical protein